MEDNPELREGAAPAPTEPIDAKTLAALLRGKRLEANSHALTLYLDTLEYPEGGSGLLDPTCRNASPCVVLVAAVRVVAAGRPLTADESASLRRALAQIPEAPTAPRVDFDRAAALRWLDDLAGRDALPFAEGEAAPAHPRLSVPLPPSPAAADRRSVELTRAAVRVPDLDAVLPFMPPCAAGDLLAVNRVEPPPDAAASHAWADGEGPEEFGIELYAALCVDLTELAIGHDELLRKYGLTAARKLAFDTYWTQRMAEDPATWLAWDRACTARRSTEGTSERE